MVNHTLSSKRPSSSRAFESEIPLIIKDDAENVRKNLTSIRHLLDYDLRPKPSRTIHDTYYDTRDNSLRQRKITLRTRKLGSTMLISSKSDIRRVSGNMVRRREIELPWTYDSVRLLARTLQLKPPAVPRSEFHRVPVSKALAAMGLGAIQERRTRRVARDVVKRGSGRALILAELAIDRVTYSFKGFKVGLSEVEIEAKSRGGFSAVREVADHLLSKYQPFLQVWSHGKFVTGLAIARLMEAKTFGRFLKNGALKPGTFQLIDRKIRSGTI
jgi:inorganic triphosphatase YgiF